MRIRYRSGMAVLCVLLCAAGSGLWAASTARERALRSRLIGTWRISSAKFNGETSDLTTTSVTYKHVTPAGFMWVSFRKGTDEVYRAAGGTYTIRGSTYTEKINYGLGEDFSVVKGTKVPLSCSVVDNRWYNKGKLANGTTIDEVWERVPPAP